MAITKVFAIRLDFKQTVRYAVNEQKTSLDGMIDYAVNPDKTEQRLFESCLNCSSVENASRDMERTKRRYNKTGGVQGYHIIQSFKPGELTPEQTHAIGVEFARQLFGERFEVVIGTHLDKHHLHNHIAVNSVSFLDGKKLRCNIAVLISAQEEVTGLGAQTGAFAVQPEYAIAVDVTHGKTPDGPSDGVFDLGSGAAIGMGPNLHRGLTKALIRTAKANDIDYSLEIMEGDTGTNAWTMQIVGRGIACALLSIPQKYMHTPVEVVSLADVEAVVDLMAAFLREFDGEVKA